MQVSSALYVKMHVKAYSSYLKRLRWNISRPDCSTRKRPVSRYIAKRITALDGSIEREQKGCQEPHILVSSSLSAYRTAHGCVKAKKCRMPKFLTSRIKGSSELLSCSFCVTCYPLRTTRSISRFTSRSAMASRLSYSFLPRARPNSIFALPPLR